jgi:septum formation protein
MTTNAMTKQAETEKEGPVLILASTSRYRRELLERLCLPFDCPFECLPPTCDEEALKDAALASGRATPEELVCMLARAKAQSIAEARPEAIVIGSDQICVFEGEILGKPGTKRRNILQLQRMQGKSHELLTAVSVLRGGEAEEHLDRCRLTLRQLSEAQIETYVEHDEPWDCAGGYKLELAGIGLMERVESEDHTAIAGLPLLWLGGALRRLGLAF